MFSYCLTDILQFLSRTFFHFVFTDILPFYCTLPFAIVSDSYSKPVYRTLHPWSDAETLYLQIRTRRLKSNRLISDVCLQLSMKIFLLVNGIYEREKSILGLSLSLKRPNFMIFLYS